MQTLYSYLNAPLRYAACNTEKPSAFLSGQACEILYCNQKLSLWKGSISTEAR